MEIGNFRHKTTPHTRLPMALYLHGLHRATPLLRWIYLHPHRRGPPIEARNIHSDLWHHHFPWACKALCCTCVLQAWSPIPCHLWQRFGIRLPLLPLTQKSTRNDPPLHLRLSSGRWWSNQADESNSRTVPPNLLQLPTRQLGWTTAPHRVLFQ